MDEQRVVTRHEEPEPMVVDHTGEDRDEAAAEVQDGAGASQEQEEAELVSDADWLRSKTSRLLGLLDEDEQAEFDSVSHQKAETPSQPLAKSQPDAPRVDDIKADVEQPADTPEVDTNIDNIRISSRLFVRNLPYDAKESDLEPIFSKYGKVEEVSTIYLFSFCTEPDTSLSIEGCSHDDLPDRDI